MTLEAPAVGWLLWGTLHLRPYVFVFLLAYLVAAARDLGLRRALGFLLWSGGVAFCAEYASTRVGIPFGLYHYTGATAARELYLSNVPVFDPLSFVFLSYASFCVARRTLGGERGPRSVLLAGVVMMLLDMVIDPLAVRGDRWFLGRIFTYPAGGVYFGVPLSNFVGWALVGWVIIGGYVWATRDGEPGPRGPGRSAGPGVALYYGVLVFNLALTLWIGEWGLLSAGILVHVGLYLLLYAVSAGRSGGGS
jgi:putative membrane protein